VIVTARRELDDQIYNNFVYAGAITETQAHAESGQHLRQLLSEDHRYVFTLIQKFRTDQGEAHPELSGRLTSDDAENTRPVWSPASSASTAAETSRAASLSAGVASTIRFNGVEDL
jgi:hypothetical protein